MQETIIEEREEMGSKEILYAIPVYKDGRGDITKILFQGGKKRYRSIHIRTFIKKVAYENYIDIFSLKKILQEQLGQKNILPYPIHSELIFIPMKVRRPRLKKDGAYGYINFIWIKSIEKRGEYSRIYFRDGCYLDVLQHIQSINRKMMQGTWLRDCFLPRFTYPTGANKEESVCREELQQIIGKLVKVYKEL